MKSSILLLCLFIFISFITNAQETKKEYVAVQPPADYTSMRLGVWFPKDHELTYQGRTMNSTVEEVKRSDTYGLDLQYRHAINHLLFMDVSIGAWYSDYSYKPLGQLASTVPEVTAWSVIAPLTIGIGVSPLAQSVINPFGMVGVGAYANITGVTYKNPAGQSVINPDETTTKFTFGGFVGVGVDIFLSPSFAISAAVKYHIVKYNENLATQQQDFSGPQVQLGITTKL